MSSVKTFFIQFSHFFSGMVFIQLFGLITFPILTRVMTIEQYGIFSLINTTMMLAVVPSKAGIPNAIIRFFAQYDNSEEDRNVFASTVLYYGVIFAIAGTLLYLIGFGVANYFSEIRTEYALCFIIMGVYQFVRPVNIIGYNFLRVHGRTVLINLLNMVTKIISVAVGLLLLLVVLKALYGYFIGTVFAEIVAFCVIFRWFWKKFEFKTQYVSKKIIRSLILFGFPLLLNEVSYLLLSYGDRYIIDWKIGHEALGVYSVGYNLAMYVSNIITFALSYAVVPIYVQIYEKEGKAKTEEFLEKSMHYLLLAIIPICFGYAAVSEELFIILASQKYQYAASFSSIILIGNTFLGLNNILNAGLYIKKRSATILYIMLFSVAVNLALNLILVPRNGVYGAALATLIACILSAALTIMLSYPHIKVRINFSSFVYYIALSAVMYFLLQELHFAKLAIALIIKVIIGATLIACGVLIKERELRIKISEKIRTLSFR
jgi:O-antigen/teichoic acid export membrane protein